MARSVENVYADAFLESAAESGKQAAFLRDANLLIETLRLNPEILYAVRNPALSREERERFLSELFSSELEPETLGFLNVILEKKREDRLLSILERFVRMAEEKAGVCRVSVVTPFPVTEDEKLRIEKKIRETAGYETYHFRYETDESLVGGIVIRIRDRVVDGSVKNRLNVLTKELMKAKVE